MFNTFPSQEAYDQYLKDERAREEGDRIHAARRWNRGEFLVFLEGYITCGLWSEHEDGTPELDRDKLSMDAYSTMHDACLAFVQANINDLFELSGRDPADCGHDFWLSRNGHGTGFWDRDLGDVGDRLHAAAKACGEVNLYVGDDGEIYCS